MKLAVITSIPTPYRDPFWNEVAARPNVELDVFYCCAGKADRPWDVNWDTEFRSEVLPGHNLMKWRGPDASCFWNPSILRKLDSGNYHAIVIGGYNHPTFLAIIRYALKNQIPYFLISESHLLNHRSVGRKIIKKKLVEWVVRNAAGLFPTGTLARDYLLSYGACPGRISYLPNIPDVNRFHQVAKTLRKSSTGIRRQSNLDHNPTILFLGRLIPKKGVDVLIRAFRSVRDQSPANLVIAGDGTIRNELEQLTAKLKLSEHVHFIGFVQPECVTNLYAASDIFVLPSSETWGVVVIEAVASGLPVIVSNKVGCHPDVVTNSTIGEVFEFGNEQSLATILLHQLNKQSRLEDIQYRSDFVKEKFSYSRTATRFIRVIEKVTKTTGNLLSEAIL